MKKKYLLFSVLCFLLFTFSTQAQNIIYINASATGANNGSSWTDAYTDFQVGVNAASAGDNVFVAGATYQPASGQSFTMKEGVKIYGGFAGTESSLSQRNLAAGNNSILKGNGNSVIDNTGNGLTGAAGLDGFTITGGNADTGGGMDNYESSPTITNCTFSINTASNEGGGLYNRANSSSIITNCTFSGNTAGSAGGGMCNFYSSSPTITNCTFSSNTASNEGGGMFNTTSSSPIITNSIFWGNTAPYGTDIYLNDGSFTINYSYTQNMQTGTGNITGSNDPFVNSSNPAGADGIFGTADDGLKLIAGSAAINTGDAQTNTTSYAVQAGNTDITGFARILYNRIDMGAYEKQTTIYVNSANISGTHNGLSWATAYDSLQVAIDGASNGDSVFVAGGTYQPASGQSFSMKEGVKIYGGFAGMESRLSQRDLKAGDTSFLKGNDSRVMVNNSNGLTNTAVLDGFKIIDGNSPNFGGGMSNRNVSPTIANCIFTGNKVLGNGGGMSNYQSSPILLSCIFSGNTTAYNGGAIYNVYSSPEIINCVLSGNKAGLGGGIYNNSSSAVITNCTFSGNNVDGITNENSFPVISNCIVYGNSNGIQNTFGSSPAITYSLVQGMVADAAKHNPDGTTGPNFLMAPQYSTAPFTGGDYHLQAGSPAINVGSNAALPAFVTTDLAGNPRIFDKANGGIVDLGAYEYQASPDSTVITTQPENIVACTSTDKNLSVSATGANLHYQWQSSTDGGKAWANEANGATETLELTNIQTSGNGIQYRVIVTGDWNKDTSNVVTLTAFSAPVISAQPQSQSVSEGASATFTATATGIDLQYQWQFYAGKGWNNIANATGVAFTIPSVSTKDAGAYQVIITGSCGQTISLPATITVATKPGQNPKPVPPGQLPSGCTPDISLQPTSQSVCIGANATFSVTASNATGYQWQYASGKGKKVWTNIANATGSTLTVPSVSGTDDGTQYQVIISSNCGSKTSKTATLKVESVAIVKEPQDAYVSLDNGPKGKQNNKMVNATFKVQAAGTGHISYQWQLSTDRSATWNDIPGATKSSLTINNITEEDDSLQYRVIVTGDCNNVTSGTATLKVNELNIVIPPLGVVKTPPAQAKKTIQHNYMVYPNPVTQSSVTIEDKLGNPLNGINLYDMAGHLVLSSQTQNAIINLQLPQLAAGTYTLQIIDQNHQAYPIQIMVQTTGQSLK